VAGDLEWTVEAGAAGTRLDKFLADSSRLGSRSRAAAALERRKVFLNGVEADLSSSATLLNAGDRVRVWADRPGSARASNAGPRDLSIVYEDASLIVVDKPAGLLSVPLERQPAASSVRHQLHEYLRPQRRRPFVVHRIDRDTSGLVLFAKSERAQTALKAQFRRREPERVYWAIVYGHPMPERGRWRDHLVWDDRALVQKDARADDPGAAEAESDYRVLESFAHASLVEVRLTTGKRNQIRIQAGLRGHPLVGEQRYVYGSGPARAIPFPRQALHARRLALRHPDDERPLVFEAEPPVDFAGLLERLRRSR
jgi:23S rRNA pseudouridine1911/1915/1917 synthase